MQQQNQNKRADLQNRDYSSLGNKDKIIQRQNVNEVAQGNKDSTGNIDAEGFIAVNRGQWHQRGPPQLQLDTVYTPEMEEREKAQDGTAAHPAHVTSEVPSPQHSQPQCLITTTTTSNLLSHIQTDLYSNINYTQPTESQILVQGASI